MCGFAISECEFMLKVVPFESRIGFLPHPSYSCQSGVLGSERAEGVSLAFLHHRKMYHRRMYLGKKDTAE